MNSNRAVIAAGSTVITRLAFLVLVFVLTIRTTLLNPDLPKTWTGFWSMLVVPSPKFHNNEVGLPEEVFLNWTDCPVMGNVGLEVNEARR